MPGEQLKTCAECTLDKRNNEFYRYPKSGKLHRACKECEKSAALVRKARRLAEGLPPGDPRHGTIGAYGNHGCRCDLCTRAKKRHHIKKYYRVSDSWYDNTLTAQAFACAICRVKTDDLVVDHDHACCPGEKSCGNCTRGLLCRSCNLAIGFFQDNPQRLSAAMHYLTAA